MNTYFGIDIDKKRKDLLASKLAKPFIDDIINKANTALKKQYMCMKMSEKATELYLKSRILNAGMIVHIFRLHIGLQMTIYTSRVLLTLYLSQPTNIVGACLHTIKSPANHHQLLISYRPQTSLQPKLPDFLPIFQSFLKTDSLTMHLNE